MICESASEATMETEALLFPAAPSQGDKGIISFEAQRGLPITGARKVPSQERPSQALSCWRRARHPSFKQGQTHPKASIFPTVLLITKLSQPLPPHGTGACWKSQPSARPLRPLCEAPSRASPSRIFSLPATRTAAWPNHCLYPDSRSKPQCLAHRGTMQPAFAVLVNTCISLKWAMFFFYLQVLVQANFSDWTVFPTPLSPSLFKRISFITWEIIFDPLSELGEGHQ